MEAGRADIVRYQYFAEKQQFELEADSYGSFWSAFAVESGSFEYGIGDSRGTADSGSVVVCPPQTVFQRKTDQPISFHFFVFCWRTSAAEGESLQLPAGKAAIGNRERVGSSLAMLRASSSETDGFVSQWRNHLLTDLIYLYAAEQQLSSELPQHGDQLMADVCSYMQQAYAEPLTLGLLAQRCGLSQVQFSRRFKRAYRINPSAFISKLRLQKAAQLLTQSELTIDEIARQSGYSNGFYLCRVFQSQYQMSPSVYRRTHRV